MICGAPNVLVGNVCEAPSTTTQTSTTTNPSTTVVNPTTSYPATTYPTTTYPYNSYNQNPNYAVSCSNPYIVGPNNQCCIDDNRNGICDQSEGYNYNVPYNTVPENVPYNYNVPYTNGPTTKHAIIDDPFKVSSFDLYGDYVSIEIQNQGDSDYIVKSVDIDQCESRNFNITIAQGERKTFNINCDNTLTHLNSDLTVTYTDTSGNNSQTAEGDLVQSSVSNYCNGYDSYGNCLN